MKRFAIFTLCSLLLVKNSIGQTGVQSPPKPSFFSSYGYYIMLGAGCGIYYLINNSKKSSSSTEQSTSNSVFKSEMKKLAKDYEKAVENIQYQMSLGENEILNNRYNISTALTDTKTMYNVSKNYTEFSSRVEKPKNTYDKLRNTYSELIYKKYYPEFLKEKTAFYTDVNGTEWVIQNHVENLIHLKGTLCWDANENSSVATDIDKCLHIAESSKKFNSIYSSYKSFLNQGELSTTENIDDLIRLKNSWQNETGLTSDDMQKKITELESMESEVKCKKTKELYSGLKLKLQNLLKENLPKEGFTEFADAFNSQIKNFCNETAEVKKESCIAIDSFAVLCNKANTKNKQIQDKSMKEEEHLANLKEQYINNNPLEFNNFFIYSDWGTTVLRLFAHNNTNKDISAFKCIIKYYNSFGEPVNFLFSNTNTGEFIWQRSIEANQDGVAAADITFQEETRRIKVAVKLIQFSDGTKWVPSKLKFTDVASMY